MALCKIGEFGTGLVALIEQLNNRIEEIQKQYNSTNQQEVVELRSQLAEQPAKHIVTKRNITGTSLMYH